jgi:prefoldin alpha subunit
MAEETPTPDQPSQEINVVASQQELQQSMMYLEYLKEQITTLKEQFEVLELAVNEHNQAIETLKDFNNLDKKNEILVPIGADSLVFAKISDSSKVIINVGAGIAIEEKLGKSIETLTSRIEKIDENRKKIKDTIENLSEQAIMLSSEIEEKYRTLQNSQDVQGNLGPQNVS